MNYEQAKAARSALESVVKEASDAMKVFPSGPMGLTPDDVKFTPEFRAAALQFDRAFQSLRKFNGKFVKDFAKEIRAERREKCATKGQSNV